MINPGDRSEPHGGLLFDGTVRRAEFELTARLEAAPGETVAVLGPNGSGKSTLLRCVAGLLPLSAGRIEIGGRSVDDAESGRFDEPEQRRVGLVFQDGRLFGHMRVLDNVAFGPRAQGVARDQARAIAARWLARLGLSELSARRPRQLSGGQAQRVALARALAASPEVLLLDEPFAALDVQTRAHVQGEVRRHLAAFDRPALLVTHDPLEALLLGDRIVILERGRIVQEGSAADITARPGTPYVAKLVGVNLYHGVARGTVVELRAGGRLVVGQLPRQGPTLVALRPSAVTLHTSRPDQSSARNVWPGVITTMQPIADQVRVEIKGSPPALVDVTAAAVAALRLAPGNEVWLTAKATDLEAYPEPR